MENTKHNILDLFNAVKNTNFRTLEDVVEEYGAAYVFDEWLRAEGIVGFTRDILAVLDALEMLDYEEDW